MKPRTALAVALASSFLAVCSPKAQGQASAQLALVKAIALPVDASFPKGAHDTDWTNFDFVGDTRIFLPAKINGQASEVLLDSGAGITAIDSAYAAQLGLKSVGDATVNGTGGDITAQVATGVTIDVGGVRLNNLTVLVFDMKIVSDHIGRRTSVILGREAFANLIVDLDMPRQRIAFHDPSTWRPPIGAARLSLTKSGAVQRRVPLTIEGHSLTAEFDLGDKEPMTMAAADAGFTNGRARSTQMLGGVGGQQVQTVTTLKALSFAGAEVHDVPVVLVSADSAVAALPANIGMPILKRYRLMTDYSHNRLYALPDAAAIAKPFAKNRAGLVMELADNGLRVIHVASGSPAAGDGWKVGDTIAAVDGARPTPDYHATALARWTEADAGRTVVLTLADGSTRKLILKDYY